MDPEIAAYENYLAQLESSRSNGSTRRRAWGIPTSSSPQSARVQAAFVSSVPRTRYVIPARPGPSVATGRSSSNSFGPLVYRYSTENSPFPRRPSQPFRQPPTSYVSRSPVQYVGLYPSVHPSSSFSSPPTSNQRSRPTSFIPRSSNSSPVCTSAPFYTIGPNGETVYLYPSNSYSSMSTPYYNSSAGMQSTTSFTPQPQQTHGYSDTQYDPQCPICNPEILEQPQEEQPAEEDS